MNDDYAWPALSDETSAIVYILEASGDIIRMNARGAEYTGRSLEQLQGTGWQDCIHPEDLGVLCSSRASAIASEAPYAVTYRMSTPSGAWRWVHDRGTPVQRGSGFFWLGTIVDVEETVSAQRQIQETNGSLQRLNRDLHHFANVVAHDLQSPLATIGTMSTWLVEEYGERFDANAKEYLNYMEKAVQRMNTLVTAALQYSRVETKSNGAIEKLDSGEVLTWTLITLSKEIKESQAEISVGPLPNLECSEHTLVQLFQNLIANAIRYSTPGLPPRIHVSAKRSTAAWTFSVADNGIGIDAADTNRIFELFQRVSNDSEGVGIGLSICRKVVENLGGRIWVESRLSEGSTFHFSIPDQR